MLKRLFEFLFGIDARFLDAPASERDWRFDPHWPGPLIGQPGAWANYLLGLTAIALLVILLRRTAAKQMHNVRLALATGCVLLAAALPALAVGNNVWTISSLSVAVVVLAALFVTRHEVAVMGVGRLALFALLLMVISGTRAWNLVLGVTGVLVVVYIYKREGKSFFPRFLLGAFRIALLALLLILLNNPILTRQHILTEPSVVAVLVDDSLSMSIRDAVEVAGAEASPPDARVSDTRYQAALRVFKDEDRALLKKLSKVHSLQFYTFDQTAHDVGKLPGPDEKPAGKDEQKSEGAAALSPTTGPSTQPTNPADKILSALDAVRPEGQSTQVAPSIITVLNELQGQRLAGVVVMTDGRDTPSAPLADVYRRLANFGVKIYPVAVGSDKAPRNIALQAVSVQDSAFKDDIVNLKATIRATGYEPNHEVVVKLTDAATGKPILGPADPRDPRHYQAPVVKTVLVPDSNPMEVELLLQPTAIGSLKIKVEAVLQPGELDETDNVLPTEISVLDAKITVLYVEGYPRWEYRYIKNEMMRDRSVNISCILTSADPNFAQEHTDLDARGESSKYKYFPFNQFPVNMEQLMECDVVLFGDVDPRQLSDAQLQMLSDFVNKKGGGFGMIAGPQYSPGAYRDTPLGAMLPVTVVTAESGWPVEPITEGFRLTLTKDGQASSIFRFFNDATENSRYLKQDLQPLFWYRTGIIAKPATEVLAEHPADLAPDRRKAPLLVTGKFGAGRTLFSAFDDSWRWRFYTGENVFDTYWIQQLRYLARSKKLGQRLITFTPDRKVYQLGEQVRLTLHVLDPAILQQLSPKIEVQLKDEKTDQIVRTERMQNAPGQPDTYSVTFDADRVGHYRLLIRDDAVNHATRIDETIDVIVPKLELSDPAVDRLSLSHVAAQTGGVAISLAEAKAKLPELLPSAARTLAPTEDHALWDKPIALVLFVFLLTSEWILRKVFGMV